VPDAPLVIVNPTAGNGRAARGLPWIRERLEPRPEARIEVTARRGDAERIAAGAGKSGHDRIVVVGGDGTVQEVVNGMLEAGEPVGLGLVPLGSGNDLARSLGLPSELGSAWRIAVGERSHVIDVGRATNGSGATRWFASAGGIGFDAQVAAAMAARRGWQAGRAGYLLTALDELRRFSNRSVRLSLDGVEHSADVLLVAIANGAYYGGGMRIAPDARPDDGLLDVCIVGDISRLTALRQLPNLYRGTHVHHHQVRMARARHINIDGDPDGLVHLDGEPFGALPLDVRIVPRVLQVARGAA
jgi:diacylglycerol kinase (ATP)